VAFSLFTLGFPGLAKAGALAGFGRVSPSHATKKIFVAQKIFFATCQNSSMPEAERCARQPVWRWW
jgi:hypothetical protein